MCEFERWLANAKDAEIRRELLSIQGKSEEIEDRFYCALSFGTGGLRGVLGAGSNRMNCYTVKKATLGLADYLLECGGERVVIAYDSRNQSRELAHIAAQVLSFRGLHVRLFSELTPTPVLSFAVRNLGASAGIVITASHNPKEYNGYKVYNSLGCQITDDVARRITACIGAHDYFEPCVADERLISYVDASVERAFFDAIAQCSHTKITQENAPSIVYSPLHGTGRKYVQEILRRIGVRDVRTVCEQELPDGNFPTCPYPNPEERAALSLALRDAERYQPDLVMATDPDADRLGIAVRDRDGAYVLLNGNETGNILLYYLLCCMEDAKESPIGTTVIKTIVTTDIVFDMAKRFGFGVKEVLTGFKYIGEAMETTERYLFGLEESYGYLVGTHARDKDAISAAMTVAEACAYFKERGKTLYGVLEEIYEGFGYYCTDLRSVAMKGMDGMERMRAVLSRLRAEPLREIDGQALAFDDFKEGLCGLPKSDVLRYRGGDYRIIIRPSGTEPKMKIYLQARGTSRSDAEAKLCRMQELVEGMIV